MRIFSMMVLLAAATAASAEQARIFAETQQSGDSDGARQQVYYAGYRGKTSGSGADDLVLEAAAGARILDTPAGSESFSALRGSVRGQRNGVRGELRLNPLFGRDWNPMLGALLVNCERGHWYLEGGIERELVDTVAAVRARNLINSYSLSADRKLGEEWVLTGVLLKQNLGDGNDRLGGVLRAAYSPRALDGFSLQLKARRVDSDFRGAGYFSPLRLEEYTGVLRYVLPIWAQRLRLSGQISAGSQHVDGAGAQPIYSAELRLRGFFTDHLGIESQLGMANTGGLDTSAAGGGYQYVHSNLSLFYAW